MTITIRLHVEAVGNINDEQRLLWFAAFLMALGYEYADRTSADYATVAATVRADAALAAFTKKWGKP